LLRVDWDVEDPIEGFASYVGDPAGPMRLFRFEQIPPGGGAASLRIAFDEGNVALVVELLVFRAQAPARGCESLQAFAQSLVKQDGTCVISSATDDADAPLERNVGLLVHVRVSEILGAGLPRVSGITARAVVNQKTVVVE
jgi:hypothetical protein